MKNGVPVLDGSTLRTITILGRAGESLRSIQRATGIRRERISKILKGQGIRVRPPRFRRLPGLAVVATSPATGHDGVQVRGPVSGAPSATSEKEESFKWTFPGSSVPEDYDLLPATALRWAYPIRLGVPEVRILRDHLARQEGLEDAAKRMGIDPWLGRIVDEFALLKLAALEIRDRLYFYESRRRR